MPIEKGNEEELNKNKNESPEMQMMRQQMEIMMKEIQSLKQNNQSQPAWGPGGLSAEQFAELVKQISVAAKERPDSQKLQVKTFVDEKDIPQDDYDPKGVLFCAYSTGYLIVDDVRQGFPVSTPYGNAIFFTFAGQNKTRDRDGNMVLNTYCAYQSKSKKEQKWLREHRYFGIKFFESAKEALSADAIRAQKLIKFIDNVMAQSQDAIVNACRQYNVPISEDMRSMRILLANRMLDRSENVEENLQQNRLRENMEEEIFKNDVTRRTPERTNAKVD